MPLWKLISVSRIGGEEEEPNRVLILKDRRLSTAQCVRKKQDSVRLVTKKQKLQEGRESVQAKPDQVSLTNRGRNQSTQGGSLRIPLGGWEEEQRCGGEGAAGARRIRQRKWRWLRRVLGVSVRLPSGRSPSRSLAPGSAPPLFPCWGSVP